MVRQAKLYFVAYDVAAANSYVPETIELKDWPCKMSINYPHSETLKNGCWYVGISFDYGDYVFTSKLTTDATATIKHFVWIIGMYINVL